MPRGRAAADQLSLHAARARYDVSILGWPPGHPLREQAAALLAANNPNENKNSAAGLEGPARRFVQFGGGLSAAQLAWLEAELTKARAGGERAIVACHLCFHPETCPPACLNWSYEQVLEVREGGGRVCGAGI